MKVQTLGASGRGPPTRRFAPAPAFALRAPADKPADSQPTPGYMRLVADRILCLWKERCGEAKDRTAEQQRRVKGIELKLDRLDEAFLFEKSIDETSYVRQRDRIREDLVLAKIDQH